MLCVPFIKDQANTAVNTVREALLKSLSFSSHMQKNVGREQRSISPKEVAIQTLELSLNVFSGNIQFREAFELFGKKMEKSCNVHFYFQKKNGSTFLILQTVIEDCFR